MVLNIQEPMYNFHIIHFIDLNNIWSNGSKSAWECAVSNFENKLRPTESKIAEKLKPRLHNLSTKQVIRCFK